MEVGIVGGGRMGGGVARRLLENRHKVIVYNRTVEKVQELETEGAVIAHSLEELVNALTPPRILWLYLPAGNITHEHIFSLRELLDPGDTIIDGGNSHFIDSVETFQNLS